MSGPETPNDATSSGAAEPEQERGAIAWMARRPIAANLLMLILVFGGGFTAINIQKEVFPAFELDTIEVSVEYPGAPPSEVEQGILLPIEEAIQGVGGIREVVSTASEGRAQVVIELVNGTDRMKAFQDVDQAVRRIRTFPEDIEFPEVQLRSRQRHVLEVVLYGQVDTWALRKMAEQLRAELLSHDAITQVQLSGDPYVTHVEIPHDRLRQLGLTMQQVADAIERSSRDVPAGTVETRDQEILVRMKERRLWAEEFAEIPVATAESGGVIRLGDVAVRVYDGFDEEGFHSQFNQQPSMDLAIYRIGDQSPIKIAEAVSEVLGDFESRLPEGIHYRIDSNSARDYEQRLSLLVENGILAIFIVLLILALFLEYTLAFWVMIGMVVSFIASILLLPTMDVSINMISMFAFLVALGIVVDDAIVIGENVYEYREAGMSPMAAAARGAKDMAVPVTFAILSNVAAFVPVLFLPGATGKFWWPLPAVVITVLIVSLLEALFILPAHLAHVRDKRGPVGAIVHRGQQAFVRGFTRIIILGMYRPVLEVALRWRYFTLSLAFVSLAVVTAYAMSDHIGIINMPEVAADEIEAGVRVPIGTPPDRSAAIAEAVTASTRRMFDEHNLDAVAEGIKTNVRRGYFIDVEIVMRPPDERTMTAGQVIELWRDQIGDLPGVNRVTFEAERGPGGWRDDISVDLSHNDVDVLEKAAAAFFKKAEEFQATRDVNDNYDKGKAQLDYVLRPEAYALGLDATYVGRQIRSAFYGAVATRVLRGTNETEVRVKLPAVERKQLHTLESLIIRSPTGVEVPLGEIADVIAGEAFTSLSRRDGRRVITVGMDVEPARDTSRVLTALKNDVLPQLRRDFPGITWSFKGSQAEFNESAQVLWAGFALAMLIVFGLLAVVFDSYLQPLIVMVAIPFGIVGAVLGHIVLGYDLSLISLMGIIALTGVVVNDSLIMVDYANRQRGKMEAFQAVHEAGIRRFRPIILTTLTTFGGLTPIILETSLQAQHLIPMAISLGFGIVFATAISLVIVPCLYLVLEDVTRLVARVVGTGDASPGGDAGERHTA